MGKNRPTRDFLDYVLRDAQKRKPWRFATDPPFLHEIRMVGTTYEAGVWAEQHGGTLLTIIALDDEGSLCSVAPACFFEHSRDLMLFKLRFG